MVVKCPKKQIYYIIVEKSRASQEIDFLCYNGTRINRINMSRYFIAFSLSAFVFVGAGCLSPEPELETPSTPTEQTEETTETQIHPAAEVIGAWHVLLTDSDAPGVPADFSIEGDVIFQTDYTVVGDFETSAFNTGTYTYENGQVHAVADNGSIEFFATASGDSTSGTWHNMVSDIWGEMTGYRIQAETFSL